MKYKYTILIKISIVVFTAIIVYSVGCKKIDLKRIAMIETKPAANITSNSVEAKGSIVDLGENNIEYGFYFRQSSNPPGNDVKVSAGKAKNTGDFSINISGLNDNTQYSIWTFIEDESGYSNSEEGE